MNPLDTKFLDGPKVVAWLEERNLLLPSRRAAVGDSFETRIRNWEKGAAADVYTVDLILCRLGRSLGELPDEYYRRPPERTGAAKLAISTAKIAQIREIAKSDSGLTFTEIGRRVGCGRNTVAKYLRADI